MKVGRNEPCPCGSGKKYKKCCLTKDEALHLAVSPGVNSAGAEPEPDLASWAQPGAEPLAELARLTAEMEALQSSEWDEEEAPDYAEAEDPESGEVRYPRPDQKLPPLSPEQKRLVEDWWEKTGPLYEAMELDPLLQQVELALTELPELFGHLGLHEEFLFELGEAMAKAGRMPEYIDLLKRLRREQRRTYSFAYGPFDTDVIGELVLNQRSEEIPVYLDFFAEYPDSEPEACAELCDLLAWRGLAEPLFRLCETVAAPMLLSSRVINGGPALDWLVQRTELPFLEAGDASPEAVSRLMAEVKQLGERVGYPLEPKPDLCRAALEAWRQAPRLKKDHAPNPEAQSAVRIHFAAWLHTHRHLPWVQALFLGDLLTDYVQWCRREKRPWLRLTKKDIEAFVLSASTRWFSGCQGVRLLGALQALVWFGEYAQAAQLLSAPERERMTGDCRRVFEAGRAAVEASDPAYRLCPDFNQLVGGQD